MKPFLYIVIIILLAACNNNSGDQATPTGDSVSKNSVKKDSSSNLVYKFADTVLEAKIRDALLKLPFVKKSNLYIDSLSDHKHGISFILDTAMNEISVMAGYNGPERFETYYNFRVDPVTLAIKIQDPVSGELIPVKEYIKKNKE